MVGQLYIFISILILYIYEINNKGALYKYVYQNHGPNSGCTFVQANMALPFSEV